MYSRKNYQAFAILTILFGLSFAKELTPEQIKEITSLPGHMKPLGSVGPYFSLPIVEGFPSPRDFFNKYVIPSTPVVFRNAASISPGFTKWSDEYFINHPESAKENVFAEGRKKEVRTKPGYTTSFADFVKKYNESDIYMVNAVPDFLKPDVAVPTPLLCDPVVEGFADNVMWFSSGGTKSVLHNDDVDNINCLFRGNKTLIFINPHDTNTDWISNVINRPQGSYSALDVDAVDFTEYPDLINVRYSKVEMKAGDCLFIPFKWHHQVNSFGNNLAVNLWFNHYPNQYFDLTPEKCGDYSNKKYLHQFEFQAVDNSNDNGLYSDSSQGKDGSEKPSSPGRSDEVNFDQNEEETTEEEPYVDEQDASLSDQIFEIVRRRNKPVVPAGVKKYVLKMMPESTQTWDEHCETLLNGFFSILDQNKDGTVTVEDSKLFYNLKPELQKKYQEASSFFFEDLMVGVQVATMKKDRELVKILLDRGELDKEVIQTIFGEEFFQKYEEEKSHKDSMQKEEL